MKLEDVIEGEVERARKEFWELHADSPGELDKKQDDYFRQAMQKAALAVYDDLYRSLVSTEAILAQRNADQVNEIPSEEAMYNQGYFEAVDDIAKKVDALRASLSTDQVTEK